MNKPDVKKLVLLNLPYVFAFYFADKIAAVFRLAPGTEFIGKLTNGFAVLGSAFANPLPSFYPVDLLVGLIAGALLKLAVFFIVIDYDAPINEDEEQYQTYFLNMVDESDLLALLDDDAAAALTTCNCKEKCVAGQVNTDCPVCKTNMSECTGTAPVTPEPDKDAETDTPAPKPEKKSNVGMILVIFALAGAAGAAYYYIKFVKGRKPNDEDMDFFDDEGYEEEPYINEDEEPQIAEDAETEGDED